MLERFNRLLSLKQTNCWQRAIHFCCAILLSFVIGGTANAATVHHKKHATHSKKQKAHVKKSVIPTANLSIQQGIDQIINSFNSRQMKVGVIVQETATGTTLYMHNAAESFTPGSTMKLFTASAALSYLGPNFIFPTQFFTNTPPQNGVIPGNLYVKFSGDPMLSTQDLASMVNTLKQQGVQTIQGNLVIDDTTLDHSNWAPGWLTEDEVLCYAAPATSIILNRNCFGLNLAPASHANLPLHVSVQTLATISIANQAVTTHNSCPLDLKPAGNNTYILSGCLRPKHSGLSLAVAYNDTRRTGTDVMQRLLAKYGITLNGRVVYNKIPADLRLLVNHDSEPLSTLITRMLKKSDNLIADTLFKTIGGNYFNTTGTWQNGTQAVRAILNPNKTGVNFNTIVMVDGAGLSRYDQVSPSQFATLLNYDYHELPANTVFYQALPRSGIDGTLRFRMGGSTLDKVHAKTGTLKTVSGLAGYVHSASNQTYTFAILVNGLTNNQASFHMLEDRICQFLAQK